MKEVEVLVLGGGPAGVNCALECVDSKLDVLLLEREEKLGGQLYSIPSKIKNLSTGVYESGTHLANNLHSAALQVLENRVVCGVPVNSVDLRQLTLNTSKGSFRGKVLVLATGYRVRQLAFEGDSALQEYVLYRSGPHLNALADKPVLVVGGGDSALLSALDLAEVSPKVYLSLRTSTYKARPDVVEQVEKTENIEVLKNTVPLALQGDGRLDSVLLQNGSDSFTVQCNSVVVKVGYQPNTELFRGQIEMDARDHIVLKDDGTTSCKNVFVAGDIVHNGHDRIAYAMGSGILAARSARRALGHFV